MKQELNLEVKVNTDGFIEKALDNLENHIITHAAIEKPPRQPGRKF